MLRRVGRIGLMKIQNAQPDPTHELSQYRTADPIGSRATCQSGNRGGMETEVGSCLLQCQ
jgi:hypothetical protein